MSGERDDPNFWWSELNHGGMFLSPAVLREFLPEGPPSIDQGAYNKLRDAYTAFAAWCESEQKTDNTGLYRWLDAVLEQFLDYPSALWRKETNIPAKFKFQTSIGEQLRPNRVLLKKGETLTPSFLVKIDARKGRLGMGKGKIEFSKFLTLLTGTGAQLGIFTNGQQFRLVFVGMDYDCWVEWDATRWFEEEGGIKQLEGFAALCGRMGTYERDEDEFPLLHAVLRSRTRQGELSQVLGEQVRVAVENLLSDFDRAVRTYPSMLESLRTDPVTNNQLSDTEYLEALYHAAIRVIMRLVFVLFAEARELLPRSIEKYHTSYGVEGLYALLEKAIRYEGKIGLRESYSAWPRLLALFRVIHEGGCNNDVPVLRYGGELFKRGDPGSPDPVLRALAIFEDDRWTLSDFTVLEILRLLKIGKVRARRGRTSTWVSGPVDFSDLRTEYIGMMYEGLLDYQLKQVTEDQGAVIFLNLGQQPALPLSLLESLSDEELENLIEKLKNEKKSTPISKESEGEEEQGEEGEELEEELDEEELEEGPDEEPESTEEEYELEDFSLIEEEMRERVYQWAERAVEVGKLVRKPRGKNADLYAYEEEKRKEVHKLLDRWYSSGQMYLVRWSGTRKGTGTFYTRPQLAVPTVHRTLEPLVYDKNEETGELIPKEPETILSLKIVDPAMGSASFLVAALRYLTDALYESLLYNKKVRELSRGGCVVTLPFGSESEGRISDEPLPVPPDDERFEQMLKARLKRHVVERCIYGVDIDPLAVELAQLSLWVETMDRELPFDFLKHKLKVGNSLVGCWLNRFEDYPLLAWAREGGDGSKGALTKKIKKVYKTKVKPQMRKWIERIGPQKKLTAWMEEESAIEIQESNLNLYSELHDLKREKRELFFAERIQDNKNLSLLRKAMDKWCAIWFWPIDNESIPPLTPDRFYQPNGDDDEIVENITKEVRFFHWELEFPDVFTEERLGFDAVLGNPPWEIMKPNSKEFFTRYDPIFRTYGKQEALTKQEELFEKDSHIETEWVSYNAFYKSMSSWVKNVEDPFNVNIAQGRINDGLKRDWESVRSKRKSYVSRDVPFRYQGSADLNTYKMFLEVSYHLIKNNGRIGMIVPSGIYTDQGTAELRKLFLDRGNWIWLFGFENRNRIFQIHSSYKFGPLIVEKSRKTSEIRSSFMNRDLESWEASDTHHFLIKEEQITKYSPNSRSIFEFLKMRDISITDTIYSNSILIFDESSDWGISYHAEIHMTNDSNLFETIQKVKARGYNQNKYGLFVNSNNDIYLPLYEGRMIGQFDFSEKEYISGKGRRATWIDIPWDRKVYHPQYLIHLDTYLKSGKCITGYKVGFLDVTSATNTRSMISCLIVDLPCGNSVPFLQIKDKSFEGSLTLCSVLNSFIFDFVARLRLGGLHLNWYIVKELPIPKKIPMIAWECIVKRSATLIMISNCFAKEWLHLRRKYPSLRNYKWQELWAVTEHERLRSRCILDAVIASLYGLDYDDLAWIIRDDPSNPKGFWRVDKDKPPELRQTTLTLLAFERLKEVGLEVFCKEDWQFPKDIQEELGPRFLPWQLEGTPEETWAECEQHAKNILGEEGYKKFIEKLNKPEAPDEEEHITNGSTHTSESNKEKKVQTSLSSWGVEE